ncbi:MAG: FAD-binding oxidoreductase [Desulfobulbaceae bacterium]|nr:FAD-binding oxidoreductase [Candidatus Kapabacteria bacterium]MBS3999448.1 FAD-binding oxidoreductase [Desulfobulbaceae bacterium]
MIIKTEIDTIHPYTFDSSNMHGNADIVYIPENFDELRQAIKSCYEQNIPMTFSGAGTGITGSRVPNGGAVISTELLKGISAFGGGKVTVQPSVNLNELDDFLRPQGFFLAPNPTEMNASIGGNVATNASGSRTFKYGAIREHILGLKLILPEGEVIILDRGEYFADSYILTLKSISGKKYELQLPIYTMPKTKNATGYFAHENMDAIDLFIGNEGTIAAIGEITLKVLPLPESIIGGIVFFDDAEKLLDFVIEVRDLSLINNKSNINSISTISARLIEYYDNPSLNLLRPKFPQIPEKAIAGIWFEQEYSKINEDAIMDKWYAMIQKYTGLSDDTWIALSDNEHKEMADFRHELPLQVYENLTENSQKKVGLDTAVPIEHFPELFCFYSEVFGKLPLQYVIFGHIGNSHLHANIFCQNEEEYSLALQIYDKCIDKTLALSGTVSAEHGIGKLKKKYLRKMYGDKTVDDMIEIKKYFDPKLLFGIGTMFDINKI